MEERNTGGGVGEALNMLDAFGSVGVEFVSITHTDLDQQRRGFRPKESLQEAKTSMKFLVPSSLKRRNNVIIRPHRPPAVLLIQLDDLAPEALEKLKPSAFLIIETSPGNFQVWLAVDSPGKAADADLARRVRKAAGADPSASGATRTAGTGNYKRKYEPNFPTVRITSTQPCKIVTKAELEEQGLVSAPETPKSPAASYPALNSRRARGVWPSYQHCLAHAPLAHGQDRPDVSRADFTWCMTAIDWGWSVEATARPAAGGKPQGAGERPRLRHAYGHERRRRRRAARRDARPASLTACLGTPQKGL